MREELPWHTLGRLYPFSNVLRAASFSLLAGFARIHHELPLLFPTVRRVLLPL